MAYDDLSGFLSELQDDGDLVRIAVSVDRDLEIAEITDRICKLPDGGPAMVFENVKGSSIPIVTNLLGSEQRMIKALRARSFDEAAGRILAMIKPDVPENWLEALNLVPRFAQLTKLPPKTVTTAICQQVVKIGTDVDLNELPIPRCWPDEPGPSITLGQLYTQHPTSRIRNVGLYPLQVMGRGSLAVHWSVQDEAWSNFDEYRTQQQQMPIAIALGGDPLLNFVASAPWPANTDDCLLAGCLREKNVELVKCRSHDLEVPAEAEIVIEGYIDTSAPLISAGIIGSPIGFYGPTEQLPAINVTAVTHRSNPIFPAMIYGRPPMEDYWMHKASERLFLPIVKLFVPEIIDYHMPRSGAFRHLLFASFKKSYSGQSRKVMHALWGLDWLFATKIIVVVDQDVLVQDEEQVWFHVGANVHPGRDTVFCEGPTHMLDHAAPTRGMGQKMGIDATRKLPEEGHPRAWPDEVLMTTEIKELVSRRWSDYGFGENLVL